MDLQKLLKTGGVAVRLKLSLRSRKAVSLERNRDKR